MKRTGKRLAVLTVAICLLVSIGVASKSFAQILWVASVDSQTGLLPVYAEPSEKFCIRWIAPAMHQGDLDRPRKGFFRRDFSAHLRLGAIGSAR